MRFHTITAASALILAVSLSACNWIIKDKDAPAGPKRTATAEEITYKSSGLFDENAEKTRGDMEQLVWLEARLPQDYTSPTVSASEMRDERNRLNLVTIEVEEPFPPSLPIEVLVRTEQHWIRTPIVIRTHLFIDDRINVGEFNTLIAERPQERTAGAKQFDVLAPLEDIPDTMLVIAKSESLLMPFDTDPATIDPATALTPPERISGHMSNPVRINFRRRGASDTPPATAPEAEQSEAAQAAPTASESGGGESSAETRAQ